MNKPLHRKRVPGEVTPRIKAPLTGNHSLEIGWWPQSPLIHGRQLPVAPTGC